VIFCVSEFQKKMGEFAASIEHSKAKSVSASGGLRTPDPPTRGSVLRPPLQARDLSARHSPLAKS